MEWPRWEPVYERILHDFGFRREKDEEARDELNRLLEGKNLARPDTLRSLLEGQAVTVFGPAETASDWRYEGGGGPLICADSAITSLKAHGVTPHVIVTDLDGDAWAQIEANREGSLVLVHAHGDNIPKLKEWTPRFPGPLLGTCQCEPEGNVHNFGGFTDGDRACHIADHFHAREITLVGFDFETPAPGPGKNVAQKRKKLAWARGLIEALDTPVRNVDEWVA